MFNLGRFNRMRFNVRTEDGDDVRLVVEMAALMRAMVGGGEDIHAVEYVWARTLGEAAGGAGALEQLALEEALLGRGKAYLYADARAEMAMEAGGGVRMVTVTWLRHTGEEMLRAQIGCGGDVALAAVLDEVMAAHAVYGAEHHFEAVLWDEGFGAGISSQRLEVLTAFFDLTLKAGHTLVIDSGGYVVLLDGENAIDRHSGDWLRLDRDVIDVRFEAAGGDAAKLEREMLYSPRWI